MTIKSGFVLIAKSLEEPELLEKWLEYIIDIRTKFSQGLFFNRAAAKKRMGL